MFTQLHDHPKGSIFKENTIRNDSFFSAVQQEHKSFKKSKTNHCRMNCQSGTADPDLYSLKKLS